MARYHDPKSAPFYAGAKAFVERALAAPDSLFTPGAAIWSVEALDDLHRRFVENPDESGDRFETKFERQLAGAPSATYQLAAECLYVYLLPPLNIKGDTKRAILQRILSWSPEPVTVPDDLGWALELGIATVGTAYHTYRPFLLGYLIDFARRWRALPDADRTAALVDPWAFRQLAYDRVWRKRVEACGRMRGLLDGERRGSRVARTCERIGFSDKSGSRRRRRWPATPSPLYAISIGPMRRSER